MPLVTSECPSQFQFWREAMMVIDVDDVSDEDHMVVRVVSKDEDDFNLAKL